MPPTISVAPAVNPEPLLLDVRGAARVLSTTVWAIRSLLWNGEVPFVKIGRKHLIDPADLRKFIERSKEAA
jgi:excisionase family DNA binding protein